MDPPRGLPGDQNEGFLKKTHWDSLSWTVHFLGSRATPVEILGEAGPEGRRAFVEALILSYGDEVSQLFAQLCTRKDFRRGFSIGGDLAGIDPG